MTRRPPRSTLFPTRRSSDLKLDEFQPDRALEMICGHGAIEGRTVALIARSEEHTSELQSHSDLVCRLLLEKKKITEFTRTISDPESWRARSASKLQRFVSLV